MALSARIRGLIVAALLLIFSIIHFGVGIGIAKGFNRYKDIFKQPVALAIYNIVFGIFGIIVGILSLIVITTQRSSLFRPASICALVLGILSLASLITALILNSQAIGYLRSRMEYRMNSYNSNDDSIYVVDSIQTRYDCCGENLWLDWGRISLGASTVGTGNNAGTGGTVITTGSGSNTGVGTGVSNGINTGSIVGSSGRKRRQDLQQESDPLHQAMRLRRDIASSSSIYGLPTTYTINLPLSCCKNGGTATANTLGGFCIFNAGNGTTNFYVSGCLGPVANTIVSQITGIAVINVCLFILSFVFVMVLTHMVPPKNKAEDKDDLQDGTQQPQYQEMQNGGYVMNPSIPNGQYNYPTGNVAPPVYSAPIYAAPTYTVYQ
ncbi:hypothetical protein I4U23_018177 [Adineta vaga]|nr:hypothetical protein I4U23_018177 [Adineta vaga]